MGRRKIEIKKIHNSKRAHSTFSKRKRGFFKKMDDLSDLTGADVCCIMQTPANNYFWHTAGEKIDDMEEMIPVIIKSIDKNAEKQSHFFQNKRNRKNFKYTKEMKAKLHESGEIAALSKTPKKSKRSIASHGSETDGDDDDGIHSQSLDEFDDLQPRRITTRSAARKRACGTPAKSNTKMDISSSVEENSPLSAEHLETKSQANNQIAKKTAKPPKSFISPPSVMTDVMEKVVDTPTSTPSMPIKGERRKFATGNHDAAMDLLINQYDDQLGHILASPSFSALVSPTNPSSALISPTNASNSSLAYNRAGFMTSPSNSVFTSPKGATHRVTFTPRHLKSPPSASSSRQMDANNSDGDTPKSLRNMPWKSHSDEFGALNDIFGTTSDQSLFFGMDE
uniref:MADS-box domain-containing protein n=1 Tax=Percolomonas cosmopolitus TaxID=63605 RepID=A0A7S1KMZ2_9EUKA|mmetsp:Transcript_2285/g.8483  ORF Transcript_2285/g.8483 Transcript_2285/m.8483 type:complete len:395 (+) Transcript_2285:282-1466(+)|eukprot:CAMPEP_0117447168 /NCGR_PEP_ID=MMETSP0759-20121206/6731_1 /TAXON_ID=63605 /ORGANISM="Percolomonas cosmopolitus, Strain WS" /LENGTH=394 /DNA_ID=CAMNT_0005239485 /DNA_START=167 /DNA_END=1351 /DNA_ORIENTATION=+